MADNNTTPSTAQPVASAPNTVTISLTNGATVSLRPGDQVAVNVGEGQTVNLPAEFAADDALLKDTLAAYFGGVRNGRVERVLEDGQLVVKIAKRAEENGGC